MVGRLVAVNVGRRVVAAAASSGGRGGGARHRARRDGAAADRAHNGASGVWRGRGAWSHGAAGACGQHPLELGFTSSTMGERKGCRDAFRQRPHGAHPARRGAASWGRRAGRDRPCAARAARAAPPLRYPRAAARLRAMLLRRKPTRIELRAVDKEEYEDAKRKMIAEARAEAEKRGEAFEPLSASKQQRSTAQRLGLNK